MITDYGGIYLSIITCCSVGITMQFATERILLASGDPLGPMIIQGIGAVLNLILDPLLIFGCGPVPPLGVAGAALATVSGQLLGMTVGFFSCPDERTSPSLPGAFAPAETSFGRSTASGCLPS